MKYLLLRRSTQTTNLYDEILCICPMLAPKQAFGMDFLL